MSLWVEWLHGVLRISHISIGFLGLALFWIVAFCRKGTAFHRLMGRSFVGAALIVGGTAMISATWALVHLDSFAPRIMELTESAEINARSQYRFLFSILLFLAISTIAGAIYGMHSMRYSGNSVALKRTSLPLWQLLSGIAAMYLFLFAAFHLVQGVPQGGIPWSAYWIPLLLGGFGFIETIKEFRRTTDSDRSLSDSLHRHIEQMFGTGIAFHTAFLVFGASRWLGEYLSGPLFILPWVLPLLVGVIATKWYISRLKPGQSKQDYLR